MSKTDQKIIGELTSEGVPRPYVLTFVFLRGYKKNQIKKSLSDLAEDSGIKKRTLRDQLYKLDNLELISYEPNPGRGKVNSITLKKYRHQ